jgi:hypothetical protein
LAKSSLNGLLTNLKWPGHLIGYSNPGSDQPTVKSRLWHTERMAKRPRDPNQLAKLIVDIATGEAEDTASAAKRSPASVKGRAGGKKGGKARARRLTPTKRAQIASIAANARWKKKDS